MKKILLLLLTFVGMASTVSAADLYLRCNLNATEENSWKSWNNDLTEYKFNYDGYTDGQWVYSYTIDASEWTGDIQFRLHKSDWGGTQQIPYEGATTEWSFSGKIQETYEIWAAENNFKSDYYSDKYFTIKHGNVGASKYKVTAYWRESDNRIWMTIDIISMPVTIGSTGKATFCCNRALDFTDTDISAYTITGSNSETGVLTTSSELTAVPANTGLYLEGTAKTYDVPVLASASSVGTNLLVGVNSDTKIYQIDDTKTNYILTVNKDGGDVPTPKFFKVNGTSGNTVLAGKAYLQIPTASAARESFWFDNETTAIKAIKQEQKFDGKVFNLAGQRIANPTKGLYIVNGKKVIK